jgi:hypothetical protein
MTGIVIVVILYIIFKPGENKKEKENDKDIDDFKGAEYFYWIKDTEKLCILFPQINTKIVFDDIDDIGTRKTGKIVAMPKITGNRDGEDSLKMELYGIVEKAVDLEIDTNLLPEFIKRAAEEYNNI